MRGDRGLCRVRRGVQVAGRREEQGIDPVRVAGQRGAAQPPAQLAERAEIRRASPGRPVAT